MLRRFFLSCYEAVQWVFAEPTPDPTEFASEAEREEWEEWDRLQW